MTKRADFVFAAVRTFLKKRRRFRFAQGFCVCRTFLSAKASHINGGILVFYNKDFRSELLGEIAEIKAKSIEKGEISQLDVLDEEFKRDFAKIIKRRILARLFLPSFLSFPLALYRAVPFVKKRSEIAFGGQNQCVRAGRGVNFGVAFERFAVHRSVGYDAFEHFVTP
ncbi:MAG: hypothetical protein L6V93_04175 [Clostridiales bacterium]|nr:MAG: hypothetical protein L6V93_04175 [Clostridiales bacterium]